MRIIRIQRITMISDTMEYKLEYRNAIITYKNGGCSFVDYPNEPNIVNAVKQRMSGKITPRKQRVLSDGKYYRVEYGEKKLSKVCKDIENVMKRVGVTKHIRQLNLDRK